ncbi:IS30 family transposase [Pelagimonas varians]|uniref:Integrase core domain protein n=1 Tax=Pelagimonas varians TaxID=696760 RepID=A0A238L6Y7_9RHOB|nr:IS30 family transposase [Pelagimonas varians]PYG26272.1 IS30 family transposase [Pelagimonas varians]SMX50066.1 Integrase core domain protein [Pelagimonas varians]
MTTHKRASDQSTRRKLSSPGRPKAAHRKQHVMFWKLIGKGLSSEDAAVQVGASAPVGGRWFREAGGMPPSQYSKSSPPLTGRYLSFAEREEISLYRAQGLGVCVIARKIGRAASTISRELRRNAATRSGGFEYRATTAQWHANRAARRPKVTKLAQNPILRQYIEDRLSGNVTGPDGDIVPGPDVAWTKRRSVRRQHRRWATAWSPEQIARRLPRDYPEDPSMRISPETIYQALFIQGRGALRRELVTCLRSGRALRVPRARRKGSGRSFVPDEIMISERPAEVADRAVPGHWEGDLILGLKSSAIGTLVERKTRFTLLLHLPPMPGHGDGPRRRNGPALEGHGAEAVRDAIAKSIQHLPGHLRKSLTWDQGAEMAQHHKLKDQAGIDVYFCDPSSPWQRGTNENTNGLLRQYFPKGSCLAGYSQKDLDDVARHLNGRPRKTLGFQSPSNRLEQVLR